MKTRPALRGAWVVWALTMAIFVATLSLTVLNRGEDEDFAFSSDRST